MTTAPTTPLPAGVRGSSPHRLRLGPALFAISLAVTVCAHQPATASSTASAVPHSAVGTGGVCAGFGTAVRRVSDEFDGSAIDSRKWAVYPDLPTSAQQQTRSRELWYDGSNASVAGGRLRLRLAHTGARWTAGGVESKSNIPADDMCVVVRARGGVSTFDDNVLSALWLQTRPRSTVDRDPNPETDIHEFIYPDRMHSALHTWTYDRDRDVFVHRGGADEQPPWTRESTPGTNLVDQFHTYAMRRHDDQLTFFIDGAQQYSMPLPTQYTEAFSWGRHLILSLQGNPDGPPSADLPLPAYFEVEFVRAYTP
jgi:Glycosyl hydrolases family 16